MQNSQLARARLPLVSDETVAADLERRLLADVLPGIAEKRSRRHFVAEVGDAERSIRARRTNR